MEKLFEFVKKLIILSIGLVILVGIPMYFDDTRLLMASWIPALIAMAFLDD